MFEKVGLVKKPEFRVSVDRWERAWNIPVKSKLNVLLIFPPPAAVWDLPNVQDLA